MKPKICKLLGISIGVPFEFAGDELCPSPKYKLVETTDCGVSVGYDLEVYYPSVDGFVCESAAASNLLDMIEHPEMIILKS